jgi:hypothetical protein
MELHPTVRHLDQAFVGPADTQGNQWRGRMTWPDSTDPSVTRPDPDPADRLTVVRQRLADGYYRQPEILDRIVAAVRRALGRAD